MEIEIEIDNETRKMRIINYLDYMDDKSLQEIAAALYNLSVRRREVKERKEMIDESGK
jgi:hypothetical protein